jgi:hypothetical protein
MLFRKPIKEITWGDVVQFCKQRTTENSVLDYKQDFPGHLENTIAAMANTFGGIILIGVVENTEGKPQLPIKGMRWDRGLSERVMNISASQIYSPVIPEIQVAKKGQKALIIVRIPQSHEAPHAVARNTQVYLRTGNRNQPERLADFDEIEWLRKHRERSLSFRQTLYQKANDRFSYFSQQLATEQRKTYEKCTGDVGPTFLLSLCPYFPKDALISVEDTAELYGEVARASYIHTFPQRRRHEDVRFVSDGCITAISDYEHVLKLAKCFYMEFNSFGLIFYKESIMDSRLRRDGVSYDAVIRGVEIMYRLDSFFEAAKIFFGRIGYMGLLHFQLLLENRVIKFAPQHTDGLYDQPELEIKYEATIRCNELAAEKDELIFKGLQHIGYAYNCPIKRDQLVEWYRKIRQKEAL